MMPVSSHYPYEKRLHQRTLLDHPVPVALKSEFSNAVYRNFFMRNFSLTGAWIEHPCNLDHFEYMLLPVLIHKKQKNYNLYLNILSHKEIIKTIQTVYSVVDHNFWLEIPCRVKRHEKRDKSFGLGLEFIK
ncbi:hypothetical protein HY745_14295 [Candidatus Desantisbacteria bacterium]|nr:hypothetical protein [Candidatus Desantisbacteria bacterium]